MRVMYMVWNKTDGEYRFTYTNRCTWITLKGVELAIEWFKLEDKRNHTLKEYEVHGFTFVNGEAERVF